MNTFSELLFTYIKKSGFTNIHFAKICGIDRTLMQKYISGKRLPKQEQTRKTLYEKLHLSPDEQFLMEEAYQREALGPGIYEQQKSIKNILENFSEITSGKKPAEEAAFHVEIHVEHLKNIVPLYTKDEILAYLWCIFAHALEQDPCEIFMVLQPGYDGLDGILMNLIRKENVCVHHLVCIDRQMKGQEGTYNLRILKKIIALMCGRAKYDVRFYYSDISTHINSTSLMPNLILAGGFVIQFDYGMNHGVIFHDAELYHFYQKIYGSLEKKTSSFLKKHESIVDTVQYYKEQHPCDCSLQLQPCFAYTLSDKMLLNIVEPSMLGHQKVIGELCAMLGQWGSQASSMGIPANRNFFIKDGIDDFMKTGRIKEFPSEFYRPLPFPWRLHMLKMFCRQLKSGLIEGYLLNEEKFKSDGHLVIQLSGRDAVHFISCREDGSQIVMRLFEDGIVNAFVRFMDGLKGSSYVRSREETIRFVEEKIEEYSAL